jgi:hypothetical protein
MVDKDNFALGCISVETYSSVPPATMARHRGAAVARRARDWAALRPA